MKRALLGLVWASLLCAGPAWAQEEGEDSEAAESSAESSEAEAGEASEGEEKADGEDKPEGKEKADGEEEDFGHMGQFGLRVGLVVGYNMIFRYDTSPYCREPDPSKGEDQVKVCGHMAPLAVNLGASFALLDFFEPYLWVRLGLSGEEQTNTDAVKIIGVGARLYTMSDSSFKIFVEPAVAYEFEGGGSDPLWGEPSPFDPNYDPNYSKDIVFHLAAGPHMDFHKNFGAYASGGVTAGILRGIHASLELDIGVQGRFP